MRIPALLALMTALLTSCHESERAISVTETRELTLFDLKYQANIKDLPPLEWRRIPGTENRALNYVTGPDDSVEIFMGVFGGGVLPNANRWLPVRPRSRHGTRFIYQNRNPREGRLHRGSLRRSRGQHGE